MSKRHIWLLSGAIVLGATAFAVADPVKKHDVPLAQHGGTVIALCDGTTTIEVDGKMTKDKAQAASNQLMVEWRKKHPEANWDDAVADNNKANPARPTPGSAGAQGHAGLPVAKTPANQHDIYGSYDSRDELVWAQETQK
ncbi:MAG TPA: hypothetical protein VIA18_25640, partial [Polyangia bacterium]|nr:hypothetical protein [Polyangia bacterium]